jgi:DNA transformation protein and related proteins
MAVTDGFRSFVLDQLNELGDVTARSMFGGVGLYQRGIFFGIIARDVLYLKVDEATRPDYERVGMEAFRPYPDRPGTMQYYAVPIEVLESGIELTEWARKAVGGRGARGLQPIGQGSKAKRPEVISHLGPRDNAGSDFFYRSRGPTPARCGSIRCAHSPRPQALSPGRRSLPKKKGPR